MANWDNQATRQEQEQQRANFEADILVGVDDADAYRGYPLPACWHKPVYLLTARERGLVFGYWLRVWLDDGVPARQDDRG